VLQIHLAAEAEAEAINPSLINTAHCATSVTSVLSPNSIENASKSLAATASCQNELLANSVRLATVWSQTNLLEMSSYQTRYFADF